MTYHPVEERFYKEVAVQAYEQPRVFIPVRQNPGMTMRDVAIIILIPEGPCITEWEDVVSQLRRFPKCLQCSPRKLGTPVDEVQFSLASVIGCRGRAFLFQMSFREVEWRFVWLASILSLFSASLRTHLATLKPRSTSPFFQDKLKGKMS